MSKIDTAGGASYIAGKCTVSNIIKAFLVASHADAEDGSTPKKYDTDMRKLSTEVVCTQDFWKELAYFIVFNYAGRGTKATVLKPDTVNGYLNKAMGLFSALHPSGSPLEFFKGAMVGKGETSWWTKVVSSAWKKAAQIRHALGLNVVR